MTVGELLVKLGVDLSQYDRDLSKAEKRTQSAGIRLGDILQNAFSFTLGMGMFEAIKRGFQTVAGETVNFNSMMEQARIGFTTMLGSAEKAQAFLNEMADFAARTPFEFPELLDAAKRMMAMGFAANEVLPTLKAVGDAAAGLGVGKEGIDRITLALGQMRAKSKVSAEEMMQLTEAGIPAWEILAEAMGKSTAEVMKLSEKGLIPANQAIQILVEGMEKRFPNMMQNMENTWEGVTSTIRDVWRMTIGALTSNLFKGLVRWLQGVREWATEFYNTFRQFGLNAALTKMFGAEFAGVISTITSILRGFWDTAKAVAQSIARNWAIIRPIVLGVVTAFLSLKIATWTVLGVREAVKGLAYVIAILKGEAIATSGIFGFISRVIQIYRLQLHLASMAGITHVGVLQAIRTALYSVWAALGPVGIAILAITGALTAGIVLWTKYAASVERANMAKINQAMQQQANALNQQNEQLSVSSVDAGKGMQKQADAMKKATKAANDNIQSFDEVHQIMQDMTETVGEGITPETVTPEATTPAVATPDIGIPSLDLSTALEQQKPTLAGFWEWIKNSVKTKWEEFKAWVGNTWVGELWGAIKQKWSSFIDWAGNIWEGVKERWGSFKSWVGSWAGSLWDSIKEKWGSFKEWAGNLWDGIKERWGVLKTNAAEVWENVKIAVQTKWNELFTNAGTTWGNIKQTISDRWQEIKTNAPIIWENIKTSINSRWQELKNSAPTMWESIKVAISNKWEELKTSAPGLWENIKGSIITRWNDLKNDSGTIWEAIKQNIQSRWEEVKSNAGPTWEQIKTAISQKWNELKISAPGIWNEIKTSIEQKWSGLKISASNIWDDIKNLIWDKWSDIAEDAKNWGKNLIDNFVQGIKSAIGNIKNSVTNVASTIKGYLGFSSPTEEGPGRYADQWAPNLMKMYADGILNNVGMVKAAVATVAENLTGMAVAPTPAFAGGTMGSRSYTPVTAPEIHLHVGTLIADDYGLKKLTQEIRKIWIAEDQRLGSD